MSITDGKRVVVEFTQPLIGDITGLENPTGYKKSPIDLSTAILTTLNQYNSSYTIAKAIDNNVSTYWQGTTAVNWIKVQLKEPKIITNIKMYLGSYYIKTFTVSCSNDGEIWTQLGGTYAAANSTTAQWYSIDIENENAYLYYRIDTLTTYSSYIYLYELQLCEDVPIGNEMRFTASFDEYNFVPKGSTFKTTRQPESIEYYISVNESVDLESGIEDGIEFSGGKLMLAIDMGVTG